MFVVFLFLLLGGGLVTTLGGSDLAAPLTAALTTTSAARSRWVCLKWRHVVVVAIHDPLAELPALRRSYQSVVIHSQQEYRGRSISGVVLNKVGGCFCAFGRGSHAEIRHEVTASPASPPAHPRKGFFAF